MNKRELSAIAKRLSKRFPKLAVKDNLLFMEPLTHTIRGVFLERSGSRGEFYVWVFFQPLYVPSTGLYFNMGFRLGTGMQRWSAADRSNEEKLVAELNSKGLPFLEPLQSPRDVALKAKLLASTPIGEVQRAVAYSFARAGDIEQAIRELDRFIGSRAATDCDYDYFLAQTEEAKSLRSQIRSDPAAAQRQLEDWEQATRKALGLEQRELGRSKYF